MQEVQFQPTTAADYWSFIVKKSRLFSVVLATVAALAGLAAISPQAEAATCGGRYAPSSGKFIESYQSLTKSFTASIYFTFNQSEIDTLRCYAANSNSKGYEVDMLALGGIPATGGNKTYSTNFPSPYLDVDYLDTSRTLTVGSTAAANFVAGVQYYASVTLRNFATNDVRTQMALTFQRMHRLGTREQPYWGVCQAHGGSDPAWCQQTSASHPMQSEILPASYVELNQVHTSTMSTSWGSYASDRLTPTATMVPGDKIYSPNRLNYLLMQSDGNLVEYIPGRAVWASNTAGEWGSVFTAQGDGNYVVIGSGNRPLWATGTKRGGTTLVLQNDRNLVVYAPGNRAIWANNVAGQP